MVHGLGSVSGTSGSRKAAEACGSNDGVQAAPNWELAFGADDSVSYPTAFQQTPSESVRAPRKSLAPGGLVTLANQPEGVPTKEQKIAVGRLSWPA
jgi:hypothetical protein